MIQEAVNRVRRMEQIFDMLQQAVGENPDGIRENAVLKEMLRGLVQYYDGGQWRQDYELDEIGLLPQNLKRGVLAQDGVYDLLDQLKPIINI